MKIELKVTERNENDIGYQLENEKFDKGFYKRWDEVTMTWVKGSHKLEKELEKNLGVSWGKDGWMF